MQSKSVVRVRLEQGAPFSGFDLHSKKRGSVEFLTGRLGAGGYPLWALIDVCPKAQGFVVGSNAIGEEAD